MTAAVRPQRRTDFSDEDIAIVGMACLVPRADGPRRFWQNIVSGLDCVGEPPDDWRGDLLSDLAGDAEMTRAVIRGGYLDDVCRFDPMKYRIMPNSVEGSEPDQFIALRCAFEALADAGAPEIPLNRQKTGVILGRGTWFNRGHFTLLHHGQTVDQLIRVLRQLEPERSDDELAAIRAELLRNLPPSTAETAPGQVPTLLVGRVANRLDLNGPAYCLDGACASALLAADHAVRELRSGRCDAVLVGGVQVSTPHVVHLVFAQLDALSRSGRIAPFSADADGTLLGQGCGILVFKRRSDAQRDGNRIYALLKGVGVSADGTGVGMLAPRQEGQVLAISRAYEQTGIPTESIELIEAHGTGTPLGDLTEIRSLATCFGGRTEHGPAVAIGSVKSMISHLIPASGAASLIKTALALYHRVLPATLHVEKPRPELRLEETPFYLASQLRPWIHGNLETPRRAGVDAFGFGGINAHAILEEHVVEDESSQENFERDWPVELVVVAAQDRPTLAKRCAAVAAWVEQAGGITLLDVAATCARRIEGASRVAIVARSLDDLVKKLRHAAKLLPDAARTQIQDRSGIFWYSEPLGHDGRLAFVFPGEGAQYVGMLADLCRHFPEVRRQFDLTDAGFAHYGHVRPPSRNVFPIPEETELAEAELFKIDGAVDAVATADRALAALMRSLGIEPDAIVGHSSGEFAALLAAGAVRLDDEEALVRCIEQGCDSTAKMIGGDLVPKAAMTMVGGVGRHEVDACLEAAGDGLVVAMDNCPNQVVLVGEEQATRAAVERLRTRGALCQPLPWNRAYHTEGFEPAARVLEEYYQGLRFGAPRIELWSCATAKKFPARAATVRELAVRQWKSPVRFRETILAMHDAGVRLFVEVGPRGNLCTFIDDTLADRPHAAIPLNVQRKGGIEQLCRALGMLIAQGRDVELDAIYRRRMPTFLDLDAAPPVAEKPQAPLRLDLPALVISSEAAEKLRLRPAVPSPPPGDRSHAGSPRVIPPTRLPQAPAPSTPPSPRPASATSGASDPPRQPPRPGNGLSPATAPTPAAEPVPTAGAPTDPRTRAFAEFQTTMRQFLQTQQRAVQARFHGVQQGQTSTAPSAETPETPDAGGVENARHVHAEPGSNGSAAAAKTPAKAVSTAARSPTSRAAAPPSTPPAASPEPVTTDPTATSADTAVKPAPTAAVATARETAGHAMLQRRLMEVVSERTGYPVEMLELDADLEADLGIDSIKRVEIVGSLRREVMPPDAEPSETALEQLTAAASLRQILGGLLTLTSETAVEPADDKPSPGAAAATKDRGYPLIEEILEHDPQKRLVAETTLDPERFPFLADHCFGLWVSVRDPKLQGLPVVPAAMHAEMMAQAAATLLADRHIVAASNVKVLRWVSFERSPRRLRVEALCDDGATVRVTIHEADTQPPSQVAEGTFHFGDRTPSELDPPRVKAPGQRRSRWQGEDVYGPGGFQGAAFHVIRAMDGFDESSARSTLEEPDPSLLFPADRPARLVLPATLIDGVGTTRGLWYAEEAFRPIFPTGFDYLEFIEPRPTGPLRAEIRMLGQEGALIRSECEVCDQQNRVVLRLIGARDQAVELPEAFWIFRANPQTTIFSRPATEHFAGVPGIEHVVISELNDFGGPILVQGGGFWSLALSRLILSRRERETYDAMRRPPAARASWLLGRVVAKDAVRALCRLDACMADVELLNDHHGRPQVDLGGPEPPLVSLAQRDYLAVAIAAAPDRFRGVGIDVEPLTPLEPSLLADSFTPDAISLLEETAAACGQPSEALHLAGWGAKEAIGKALGRGVLRGPRSIRIVDADPATGRISAVLAGAMAEAYPEFSPSGQTRPIDTYWRRIGDSIVTLCLLPAGSYSG